MYLNKARVEHLEKEMEVDDNSVGDFEMSKVEVPKLIRKPHAVSKKYYKEVSCEL